VEYDTSYPKKVTTENQLNIWVPWQQPNMPWNEICAKVIEVFGLPGDRFIYSTSTHFMVFRFKSKKDFVLGEILLSEYMTK
jgi:hypothetical protein